MFRVAGWPWGGEERGVGQSKKFQCMCQIQRKTHCHNLNLPQYRDLKSDLLGFLVLKGKIIFKKRGCCCVVYSCNNLIYTRKPASSGHSAFMLPSVVCTVALLNASLWQGTKQRQLQRGIITITTICHSSCTAANLVLRLESQELTVTLFWLLPASVFGGCLSAANCCSHTAAFLHPHHQFHTDLQYISPE